MGRRLLTLTVAALLSPQALAQPAAPSSHLRFTSAPGTLFQVARPAVFKLEHPASGGHGTGFFIDPGGLALTAYHVVYGTPTLTARTLDGRTHVAEVIGYDEKHDLALLRVHVPGPVSFLPLAQRSPRLFERVLAVGNSGEEFLDAELGKLRAVGVGAGRADFPSGTLELDVPLRPGDSGGPVINAAGEAVGVTSYIRAQPGLAFRSFAVPVTRTSALLRDLRAGVKRDAPVLGISGVVELDDGVARAAGLEQGGLVFHRLAPGGPADLAGLRALRQLSPAGEGRPYGVLAGDVIIAFEGRWVRDLEGLMAAIRAREVGESVELSVRRGAQVVKVRVKLGRSAQVFTNGN